VAFVISCDSFTVITLFIAMTPDQDYPSDKSSVSGSEEIDKQVAQLIRLVRSGEQTNIELAFLLAEGLGNPPAFLLSKAHVRS